MPSTSIKRSWLSLMELVGGVNKESTQQDTPVNCARSALISIEELLPKDRQNFLAEPAKLIYHAAKLNNEVGSSTVVVVTMDLKSQKIKTAMIGDSGYMIIRANKTIAENNALNSTEGISKAKWILVDKSQEQQHGFNFPFQIGTSGDDPRKSQVTEYDIKKDDIIVVGTDGLFDNLFAENIIDKIEQYLGSNNFDSNALAKEVADEAFRKSIDTRWNSPFAVNARKARYSFRGGKSDDITVIVGRVESDD
jgi:protein phosphatase PTC7